MILTQANLFVTIILIILGIGLIGVSFVLKNKNSESEIHSWLFWIGTVTVVGNIAIRIFS